MLTVPSVGALPGQLTQQGYEAVVSHLRWSSKTQVTPNDLVGHVDRPATDLDTGSTSERTEFPTIMNSLVGLSATVICSPVLTRKAVLEGRHARDRCCYAQLRLYSRVALFCDEPVRTIGNVGEDTIPVRMAHL